MYPSPRNVLLGVTEGTLRVPVQVAGGDKGRRLDFVLRYNYF